MDGQAKRGRVVSRCEGRQCHGWGRRRQMIGCGELLRRTAERRGGGAFVNIYATLIIKKRQTVSLAFLKEEPDLFDVYIILKLVLVNKRPLQSALGWP